jgi:putative ABC transport system substrate-binding protein
VKDLQAAAPLLGLQLEVFRASSATDIDEAFARLAQRPLGALVVTADGFLIGRQDSAGSACVSLCGGDDFPLSRYVAAGGLMSYGASLRDAFCQTGLYVGKILKRATPADLAVMQRTKFELVINLKTAIALCLTVAPSLLDLADEVIE